MADYAHSIMRTPPEFQTFIRPWISEFLYIWNTDRIFYFSIMFIFTRKNLLIFRCVSVRESRCFSMAAAVTWAAFGRLAFAMGVSWVMFACITGYGGIINSFLSWPLFSPLSKLTYCTYLIHIDVIFLFFYSTKRPMYFSEYTIVSFVFLIFTY